jgi:PAS domain S-box-containing protein
MNDNDYCLEFISEIGLMFGLFDAAGRAEYINPGLAGLLPDGGDRSLMPVLEALLGHDNGHHVFAHSREGNAFHMMRTPAGDACRLVLRHKGTRIVLVLYPTGEESAQLILNQILAEMIDHAPEPVGIADATHRMIYLNRSARMAAGVEAGADPGTLQLTDLHPYGIGGMDTIDAMTLATESGPINVLSFVRDINTNRRRTVGQTVMAHSRAVLGENYFSSIFRKEGKIVDCPPDELPVEQLQTLVGEQARIIGEHSDQLYYSREIWRSLVEYNQSLVLVTDPQGTINYANSGFVKTGTLPLIGLNLVDALVSPPLQQGIRAMATMVASGERMHDSVEGELALPNGDRHQCLWLASHLKRRDGGTGITWVITDISREYAARQRAKSMEEFAITGRMAARIAHEFNNPLAGIKGAIALVKMDVPAEAPGHKYLCMVESEINRLSAIIRQMYGLYKPEIQEKTEIDLRTMLGECCFLMSPAGAERNIRIEVGDLPAVTLRLQEQYVREIIYNLLRNAIDASFDNGVITVQAMVTESCLHLSIDDEGQGLPPGHDINVFEPFFTTKKTFQGAGLGLGLSVCRGLAESMGGSVTLSPREPAGARALVCLPLQAAAEGVRACADTHGSL